MEGFFWPDLVCGASALLCLVGAVVVVCWPERRPRYRSQATKGGQRTITYRV